MLAMDLSLSWNLDVMVRVCERLEVDDVLQCGRVCSKWREFVESERMWRTLWDRDLVYFASASKSFGSHTFAGYREAYVYFFAFAGTPIFEVPKALDTMFTPDFHFVKNNCSDETKWDCGYNHKTHEVGLAFRGETERLRSLLETKELGIDVNKLQCYKHWYYYGNFSNGVDGLIYHAIDAQNEKPKTLIDDVSDFSSSEQAYLLRATRSSFVQWQSSWNGEPDNQNSEAFVKLPKGFDFRKKLFTILNVPRTNASLQSKFWAKYANYCGTLLHWAVLGNHLDTVKLLCEFGADVTIAVPKLNAKAIDIAKGNCYVEIYYYLKSCEQKPVEK